MTPQTFDAHVADYDSIAQSALGRELRSRVHSALRDVTAPGDSVVDLGCGTGIDAAWLAPQVDRVLACDVAAGMIQATRDRCAAMANVSVRLSDAMSLTVDEPADVVLANFGVVNCVGDLGQFGAHLHQLITPGGYAVLVTMARWCPIELTIGAATRNRSLLRRRSGGSATNEYQGLQLRYASARDLQAAFGPRFELTHAEALGLVLPPFEQRGWVEDRAPLRNTLSNLDRRLGRLGARAGLGDHHIAVFRRTP